ncbi:(4S)-4-hydroxy-5-phosphonooxypentane-2,3-dione isomerase [Seminavis robusta]|uniref:(4S)-4-hydroxy-5-phosphonooxypentane-2,3-dione isomerase n=1 Tax=Seminavis robusta TaxID=568900 RepID=A0A9N8DVA5_9STRA|nr:(4S)-4-hydroxy-5-phosphonooxypentane-2,3-dione isomerase [Seminavis robusta]|eukprot:Sro388_g132290.1 (4S)-4-hydroxy-5-phosphonooxypentane-2,3-dione isomerase (152) ;mRNA; r:19879-20467
MSTTLKNLPLILALLLMLSHLVTPARSFVTRQAFLISTRGGSSSISSTATKMAPFAVVVEAEVDPDRMAEFLEMIKTNAENSRKEPGCIRFDVLRDQEAPNKFIFYELYKDPAAVDFHKTQPHYAAWAKFKESGGVISSVSKKNDGEFVET